MSLDDIRRKETIDLAARSNTIQTELVPELERRIDDAEDADEPDPSPQALRSLRDRLEGQADACERVVDALGGSEFVIQELMTAETAKLQDDVQAHSIDVDFESEEISGSPQGGYHKVRTLELALVSAPDEMPAQFDHELSREVYRVGKLPDHVTDYLYECIMALNDAGEIDDVGNLSSYGLSETTSDEQ